MCYSKYDVNFPEGLSYGEDTYVSVCLLAHPIKMAYVPKAFYHYVQNVNYSSLTRRPVKILVEQCENSAIYFVANYQRINLKKFILLYDIGKHVLS